MSDAERKFVITGRAENESQGFTPRTMAEHLAMADETIQVATESAREKALEPKAIYARWNSPKKAPRKPAA